MFLTHLNYMLKYRKNKLIPNTKNREIKNKNSVCKINKIIISIKTLKY